MLSGLTQVAPEEDQVVPKNWSLSSFGSFYMRVEEPFMAWLRVRYPV